MNEENKAPGSSAPTAQSVVEGILKAPTGPEKLDPNLVQKPIRTFESDLAEALAKKQGSSAAISIAESKRKEEIARASAQPAPQMPTPRGPSPVAPTRATAIPGAEIELVPNVERDVTEEINAGLEAANVAPKPQTPPPPIVSKVAPIVPPPAQPKVAAIVTPPPPPPKKSEPIRVPQAPVTIAEPRHSIVKPVLLTLFSFILIGGGIFAGYKLFSQSALNTPPLPEPEPLIVESIIPSDKQGKLSIESTVAGNGLISRIYNEFNKTDTGQGKIFSLSLLEGERPLAGSAFISKLDTHMPDVITRSLTDRFMIGLYGDENGQKTTYLALTTDFFQNAFAGMLMWEEAALADDLALLLNFKDKAQRDSLGSNSAPAAYFNIRGTYSDKVIRNRDVREFHSPKGDLLFLYSFINKETLLLTTSESAFIGLVDRIEKDAYVR